VLPVARTTINLTTATSATGHPALASTPALAAALRRTQRRLALPEPLAVLLRRNPLVQMYRIPAGDAGAIGDAATENAATEDVTTEAQAAAHVLLAVAERLRRLAAAYGEWTEFDVEAYFDLSVTQAARLVHVVERVSTVHVVFYADQLLPAFQTAAACWQTDFRPAYLALRRVLQADRAPRTAALAYADRSLPRMVARWERLVQVVQATRAVLSDELGYWAANGSDEERAQWRWAWPLDPAPGLPDALLPSLSQTPTLTLAVDFALPAYRQPGRLRRLRRLQARRGQGWLRARSG